MPADTSTATALLKDVYEGAVETQLMNDVPMLNLFERRDGPWRGNQVIRNVRVNRNRGVYATAESGAPPTAGQQQTEQVQIPRRHVHGSISLTAQLIKAARGGDSSFADGMRDEMDNLVDDLRVQKNFYIWGDGRGIRCLADGDPGTDTRFEVDAPGGVAGDNHGNRFLNVNDYVVWVNPATGTLRAGGTRRITAIAADGTYADVDAAIDTATADNDFVLKAYGSDASIAISNTDWQHAPMGMLGLVDNGTYLNSYFGLNRNTFPILQSTVIASVGALSADVIQRGIDVAMQVGYGKIAYHIMHTSVRRAYLTLMENDRRYTGEKLMKPDAGTKAATATFTDDLSFGGVPLMTDPDAPYGTWFGFDNRSAVRYVNAAGEWADEDGNVLSRSTTAVDTFTAWYRVFDNFYLGRPNQSFRLDGITASLVVAHRV